MAIEIKAFQDGPLVVSGRVSYKKAGDEALVSSGGTTALCRCGRSGEGLLCDGTHKTANFRSEGYELVVDGVAE